MIEKADVSETDLGSPLHEFNLQGYKATSKYIKVPIKTELESQQSPSFTLLSRIFFNWSRKAMSISNKTSLKASLIISDYHFNITRSDLAYLRNIWFGGYNNFKYCPLLLAIIRANIGSLVILFLVTFFATALKFVQIYLLRQLILVFQWIRDPTENEEPKLSLYVCVTCFLITKIVYILTQYQIKYLENMIGRKTANQISSIVYDKTIKAFSFSKQNFTEGEVFNYIQVDVETLGLFFYYCPKTIVIPFQFAMYFYMLFQFFGISFLSGFITFIILMIISYILQQFYMKNQKVYLKDKDKRMKKTSETFHMLKTLKLFAWDDEFINRITEARNTELKSMKTILNLEVFTGFIHWAIPLILSIVSVGVFTYINGIMNIANLLTSMDIFDSMSGPLYRFPTFITSLLNALVSMGRIGRFLNEKENITYSHADLACKENSIKITNCNFGTVKSRTNEQKLLLTNVNLTIPKGELVAVLGETGSGKSCLIHSLLSGLDMFSANDDNNNKEERGGEFIVNGTFSYAAQAPWIMNETIQQNIVFFKMLNKQKYEHILDICQLKKDMKELPAGDVTEVGANGSNLSGGQKARISLARAVYTNADIYLLDDPISSCDSHVSMKIFKEVFVKYLTGKTRILVTNDVRNLHLVDRIIHMDKGKIHWIGSYKEIKEQQFYIDMTFMHQSIKKDMIDNDNSESLTEIESINTDTTVTSINKADSTGEVIECNPSEIITPRYTMTQLEQKAKLTKDEDQAEGRIGCALYNQFFKLIGGYWFLVILIIISISWQLAKVSSNVWLAQWTLNDSNNLYSFIVYSLIGLSSILCLFIKDFIISRGVLNINRKLHSSMLHSLIKAPINLFHDTIPIGQIINRLTIDLENCKPVIKTCSSFLKANCTLIGAIIVCCRYNKYCLLLSPILMFCGLGLCYYYVNAGRDLHRLDGITRSPILSLYSETVMGMSSIKAYGVEGDFKDLFFDHLDDYYTIVNFKFGAETWFSLHLELLSVLYIFFILLFAMIFKGSFTAQAIGLLIKYSVSFSEEMLAALDYLMDIETSLVSIERCNTYTKVIQEQSPIIANDDTIEKHWPSQGKIEFKAYSTRYRPEIDLVLKDISFTINPREKIGVVGRTGSGKSTLSLCLFRIIEREAGEILIDGIDIAALGTMLLRKNITIVPQDPVLFEGTLKDNLDPLNHSTEDEINTAIGKVHLFTLMQENGQDISLGMNMLIKENGNNLSLGEKQLICFARALLQKNKIIILDEATANVDQKTEKIIQKTIDTLFTDYTMITIAHRIQTVINCDKIILMDNGKVAEYDTPSNLLSNHNSLFCKLYHKNHQ